MMTHANNDVALGFTPEGNAQITPDKRWCHNHLIFPLLIPFFFISLFTSLPAQAALGDFLYKWGATYYFSGPSGVTTDSSGNTYVVDSGNNRIQVFSINGTFLRQWGSYGSGDGQFNYPQGVVVDGMGNVYVADTYNARVQVFSSDGIFLRKWGSWGSGDGQFSIYSPHSIAVDSNGNVYVADAYNARVQVFKNDGTFLRKWGTWGNNDGQFSYPYGIAVDANNNVYVAEYGNNRVQVFSSDGRYLRKWGSYGSGDGQLWYPFAIAVDSSGRVFVTDTYNFRIQVFNSDGTFLSKWGSYGIGDGQFSNGQNGISVDPSGHVFVADVSNNRIQIFTSTGTFLGKWATFGPDDGQFNQPWGIAVDPGGNIYVADTDNGRIQVFRGDGSFLRKWGTWGSGDGQLDLPRTVAVDANGNVYVDDYNGMSVFSSTGVFLRKFAAPYSFGVSVDSSGHLYVANAASSSDSMVQVFNNDGTLLRSWGTYGSGDGQFLSPSGIAVNSSGIVFVGDFVNNRIQFFNNTGALLGKWGSRGSGDGQFYSPSSIAVDSSDNVYVSDSGNQRVQVFRSDGTFLGKWGLFGSGDGQFNYPRGIAADAFGNVYVADWMNNRIQAFEGVAKTDTQAPVTTHLISGTAGNNSWYVSNVTVSLTATDTGSGVKEIHYAIDGGAEVVTVGSAASASITTEGTHSFMYYAKDNAGNEETPHHTVAINIDKTPPAINITGVTSGAVYTLGAVPTAGYTVADNLSGVATHNSMGDANNVGAYTYTVNATDKAGNAASLSAAYSVVYNFGGFLAPVSLNRPFMLGSTIPVKFQLTDASGSYISTAIAAITVQLYSADQPVGDPIDATSTSGADTGNTFRYDSTGSQYIYNLNTSGLSQGTWQIRATLDDGTMKTAFISLKAN